MLGDDARDIVVKYPAQLGMCVCAEIQIPRPTGERKPAPVRSGEAAVESIRGARQLVLVER